ncbi:hypothetical protein, partial [Escherichia coli]|uniref:hypothetical protein n=1 Tax=Escherichia coli TaxID=562 RepID=UPI001BC85F90
SIFSHPVYLFLREFSLQDFRGGSLGRNDNKYTAPAPVTSPFLYAHFCALFRSSRIGFVLRFLLRFVFEKNAQFFAHFLRCLSPCKPRHIWLCSVCLCDRFCDQFYDRFAHFFAHFFRDFSPHRRGF